ncbi:MAG: hypothetical protein KMY54_01475, partial [Erysipelothrix sp.]|nr:hypothetical protein [Erysipelothrix sp.]
MERFNQKTLDTITAIVARHTGRQGPVKLMLHDVQHELGYIPFYLLKIKLFSNDFNNDIQQNIKTITNQDDPHRPRKDRCGIQIEFA